MRLGDGISVLKNIGEKRKVLLNKLNIFTVKDLLEYYPRDYEDRSKITNIRDIIIDETNIIKAKLVSSPETMKVSGLWITKIKLEDETGSIVAVWYNQPYMKNNFKKGQTYIFVGKVVFKYEQIQLMPYDYEIARDGEESTTTGRIIPKYQLMSGLTAKLLRNMVYEAISGISEEVGEPLPPALIEKYGLCGKMEAVKNIHFPSDNDAFYKARKRLVFEELFGMQMLLLQTRSFVKSKKDGVKFFDFDVSALMCMIPFKLTDGQQNAVKEIIEDLGSTSAMNRMLQGDVGSGKTVVAAIACYICIINGYQAAIMAPTEVLAKQHFEYFTSIFEPLGIMTAQLLGSMGARSKREALEKIASGEAKMVVGTHAVIQENVEFYNLALAITDEQHRFGVRQRKILTEKGNSAHMLVMTATPIPRSLALILYGDLDISTIEEKPPNRQSIDTFAVTGKYRNRIFDFVKKEIEKGNQAYFICPAIEGAENSDLKSVIQYEREVKEYLTGIQIAILHGKMKQADKDQVMAEFKSGRIAVLISTTVIEVGVNVPNATVMVIEDAQRFGLSQLHQLRGRVGRGISKSYCILITDSRSKITKERMDAITSTQSGFTLSRLDLTIRGPGDFFGVRQHGLPEMKIANLYRDMDILKLVQEAVSAMNMEEMREAARVLDVKKPEGTVTL